MAVPTTSQLESLTFNLIAGNQPSIEEMQANLALWVNTQFTFDSMKKGGHVHTHPTALYSSPESNTSTMSSPNTVTYESLANYLDFELPQQHLLSENPETLSLPALVSPVSLHDAKDKVKLSKNKEKSASDEEKRKRNTAASARFRIKKKQKEKLIEQAVKDMSEKSQKLEKYVNELESEIKFLKGLLLEKDSCKPLFEETKDMQETK